MAVIISVLLVACSPDGADVDLLAPETLQTSPTTPPESTTAGPETTTESMTATAATTTEETEPERPIEVGTACWASPAAEGTAELSFSDQTAAAGLIDPLTGMHLHAAGFGDINGDHVADLVVGSFADRPPDAYANRGAEGPAPDTVLAGGEDRYSPLNGFAGTFGRTSGVAIVDLDQDGDSDLVLSRNVVDRSEIGLAPSTIYENTGNELRPVDAGLDQRLGGRSVGVFDYDGDGLLDLLITVDRYRGGSSRLYRNNGGLRFVDVTTAAGLPDDLAGFGVATSDVDGDGDVDFFVAGSNRLYVDEGEVFRDSGLDLFSWPEVGDEDVVTGASFGDVDRDGRLDLVVGHHFNSTIDFDVPAPIRLFLNRTEPGSRVHFIEVTEAAGLIPLPTKAPHVQIADMDNDGWPDLVSSASAETGTRPAVFMSEGLDDGTIRFSTPQGLDSSQYWVTAPVADVDRDGRLDVLLVEWEPSLPSLLLRNETGSGHWLSVSVDADGASGIGGRVRVYRAGGLGDQEQLLGSADIVVTAGYSAGIEPIAHIGLGGVQFVDIEVQLPDGTGFTAVEIAADQHVRLPGGCG